MKKLWYSLGILVLIACKFNSKQDQIIEDKKVITHSEEIDLNTSIERGGLIYTDFCMQCHLANGMGIPGTFPPLAKSNWLIEKRMESIHAVKFGQRGEIEVNGVLYNGLMAPMGLTDQEVADVMNYVMNSWGNTQKQMVTPDEVSKIKK